MTHSTCTGGIVTARAAGGGDFRRDVGTVIAHECGAALHAILFPTTLAQVMVNSPFAGAAALLTLKVESDESGLVPAAASASLL